ncbi:hypothetical protein HanRHA438_Chr07g0291971 [Helianthus annuus]|nr:hypothetical protein HanRHA438_Chr07g0291971 [Helianthus annuus]
MKFKFKIQGLRKARKPSTCFDKILFRLTNPRDSNVAWRVGPRSQTLKKARPLQPLFDVEIDHMNSIFPFECSQQNLVRCEMNDFGNRSRLIQQA